MTEQEMYDACKDIENEARRRGIRYPSCCALIRSYLEPARAAAVYLSMSDAPEELDVESPTFEESFERLRANLANYIPDEDRLASILGYTEVRQAAE